MTSSEKIKVLMFGWELPPFNSGGLGVACSGIGKALDKLGIDLTFVLPRKIDISSDFMRIIFASDFIPFPKYWSSQLTYTFPALYKQLSAQEPNTNQFSSQFSSLLDEVALYGSAAELIAQQETFDIIHAHDWLSFPAGMKAKEISGKPLIAHIHSTEFDRTGNTKGNVNIYAIEKDGMKHADKIISVSNLTKKIITHKYPVDASKITVVYNGVEQSAESLSDELVALKKYNKIVIFVGRLTLQKGPDYFLKAAKKVLEHDPHVIFLIIGSGDMQKRLIKDAISFGISDKVFFTGFLRDSLLTKLYASADLFVMPSVSEPFGITGLEAAINGTPVLVSKQSGVSEVLTHALKVDFWDINEMSNKILAVLGNSALQKTLKKNALDEAKQLTWDKSAIDIRDVYKELLQKRN